jgi:hypothetical protein
LKQGDSMDTVFSHIIQKRFSQVNEDVATDALTFILHSSEAARNGMLKLLRGIVPDLPVLHFRAQQIEGTVRPDMWGFADAEPRVFIENKFWAGLTDNQPVPYLKQLTKYVQPTLLLVVAPAAREQTLWREILRRLNNAEISVTESATTSSICRSITTSLGPTLALTSWSSLLSVLEHELADDHRARGDLVQLRSLCDAADNDAFTPVTSAILSDQRTPAFILQLSTIVQASVGLAITEDILDITRLMPQASWERIGRYVRMSGERGAGGWLGIHFGLWKKHGGTPLWIIFSEGEFGRAQEVRWLIEPWAAREGVLTAISDHEVAVALDIPIGEEKAEVVRFLVDRLKEIKEVLDSLSTKPIASTEPE